MSCIFSAEFSLNFVCSGLELTQSAQYKVDLTARVPVSGQISVKTLFGVESTTELLTFESRGY